MPRVRVGFSGSGKPDPSLLKNCDPCMGNPKGVQATTEKPESVKAAAKIMEKLANHIKELEKYLE